MIAGLVSRIRSVLRGIRRRPELESEMAEEFRAHMELRAADLVRSGLTPAEAARRARLEFGSTEQYKAEARQSRGLGRVDELRVSWLDFKLGFRMLIKYPGLTLVGGVAIAFATWVGAGTFELVTQVLHPTMPFPEGERIVGLRVWDARRNQSERRLLHDFVTWRSELKSVTDLGAFRSVPRNLILGEGVGEPIEVVEISPSAFRVTRVPPLLGRTLVDADALDGAPAVVVIGHELWERQFDADPNVVGRAIRLGRTQNTIVGVMPAGYEFPVNQNIWTPLRLDPRDYERREGPSIRIFGRLAPGASLESAQVELGAIGARNAADFPDTDEHLRPQVLPYARSILEVAGAEKAAILAANVPMLMLLVLICGNVALLMFARAATRESEIIVRTALGATRQRIIMQLFAEALVLGTVAALVGLAAAGWGLDMLIHVVEGDLQGVEKLPFWFTGSLSPTTLLYAAILTLLGAVIAGVVPALKVTRGMGSRLQQMSAGAGGMRFGGVWTAVIVVQVALTVAFPVLAFITRRDAVVLRDMNVGFAEQEYLATRMEMDGDRQVESADTSRAGFRTRYAAAYGELERRLRMNSAVEGVTYADRLPRMYHPHRLIELDSGGAAPINPDWPAGYRVSDAHVDPRYFEVMGAPVLEGRGFHAGDLQANAVPVIVNQSFVSLVLGGRNPIGRRIRYVRLEGDPIVPVAERGPWYEIVGVVRDMGMAPGRGDPKVAGIYHPVRIQDVYPAQIAVHVRGNTDSFALPLRAAAAAIDPTIRLHDTAPLAQGSNDEIHSLSFWYRLLIAVSVVALVLSLAGIYAVLSFTVARRTREIGIRVALGARHRDVIVAIFARPLTQVAIGIAGGVALLTGLVVIGATKPDWRFVAGIVVHGAVMMVVCLLACIVPTQRVLKVDPTEALRGDG